MSGGLGDNFFFLNVFWPVWFVLLCNIVRDWIANQNLLVDPVILVLIVRSDCSTGTFELRWRTDLALLCCSTLTFFENSFLFYGKSKVDYPSCLLGGRT